MHQALLSLPKHSFHILHSLLKEYQTLENILQNAERIQKQSVRFSIMKDKDRLRRNYRLIQLTDKAALPFSMDELLYTDTGLRTADVLRAVGVME